MSHDNEEIHFQVYQVSFECQINKNILNENFVYQMFLLMIFRRTVMYHYI